MVAISIAFPYPHTVLGVEPRLSCVLSKCSTTEQVPQQWCQTCSLFFFKISFIYLLLCVYNMVGWGTCSITLLRSSDDNFVVLLPLLCEFSGSNLSHYGCMSSIFTHEPSHQPVNKIFKQQSSIWFLSSKELACGLFIHSANTLCQEMF